jgi:P4 family phage/plasmid primase-like protien
MGLSEFLEHYQTGDSKNVTHTSMTGGKWKIPSNESKLFYKLIRKAKSKGEDIPPITESMGDFYPLVFDFDLKFIHVISEKPYNPTFLKHLSEYLWNHISDVIDIDDENNYNEVYVMGKSKPYPCEKGTYKSKDGIHFLYPKIILSKCAYKILCGNIQNDHNALFQLFKDYCSIQPSNLNGTLFDGKFTRWMPYLCHKPNEEPYMLEHVFRMCSGNAEIKNLSVLKEVYTNERLMNEMSMFRADLKENVSYTEACEKKLKPISTSTSSPMVNEGVPNPYSMYYVDNNNVINPYKIVEEEELKLITHMCECFSIERACEYGKWLNVGLALHNTNSDKFLSVWETFSKKYPRYNNGSKRNCAEKWKTFSTNNGGKLTQGSLRYWANYDNSEKFNKVMINNLGSQIDKSVNKGHDAHQLIAKVIYKYYQGQFLCVDIGDDWYFFDGNHWKKTLKANELKKRIHDDIHNIYYEYSKKYKTIIINSDEDSTEHKIAKENHERCTKFQNKLLQENYVITVIAALRHLFYKENIAEEFDSNLHLLGLNNGIVDLKEWVFREGRPEDYITNSTNYSLPLGDAELPIHLSTINRHLLDVIPNYSRFKEDLLKFFAQLIPDPDVREYTMTFLAKCLSGENRDEGFYIWTGSGGNGKSKLIELMQLILGDYGGGLPVSLITGKRASSNSATPEMERTKGLRLVTMQEPEADEKLNVGLMKELTGNDKIQARGLFKEPIEFVPQYKLLLMCNDLPNIPSNDDGTWRRLEVVEFGSRFVGEEDYSKIDESRHVYKRDKELRNKLPAWKLVGLGILLEYWMKYDKEGITIPKQVNNKTKSYRNENDVMGQWIDQSCEIGDNIKAINGLEEAPSSFKDLYNVYKEWCSEQGYKIPDKKKAKGDLMKWQEQSKFGLSIGKTKKDGRPNGSLSAPMFNLTIIDVDE